MSFTSQPKLKFLEHRAADPRAGLASMAASTEALRRANDELEISTKGHVFSDKTREWLKATVVTLALFACSGCALLESSGTCEDCVSAPETGGSSATTTAHGAGGSSAMTSTIGTGGQTPTSAVVRVLSLGAAGSATDTTILTTVEVVNVSKSDIDLSTLSLRYWFADTDDARLVIDGKPGPAAQVIKIESLDPTRVHATHYMQVGFSSGNLVASYSLPLTFALHHADWSSIDETDDYSWPGSVELGDELTTVTVYRDGVLVGGIEP